MVICDGAAFLRGVAHQSLWCALFLFDWMCRRNILKIDQLDVKALLLVYFCELRNTELLRLHHMGEALIFLS